MKKMIFSLLAIAAMTSCTTTSEDEIDPNAPVEIKLSAGINTLSRAAITGTAFEDGNDLFHVTAYKSAAPTSDYSNAYFDNIIVNQASNKLAFAAPKYYPADGTKLYFYAYTSLGIATTSGYTPGTASNNPMVQYEIDGTQEIMSAQVTTGIGKTINDQANPEFTFSHQLMRVQFKATKGDGFSDNIEITSITIANCKTKPQMNIIDGSLDWNNASDTPTALTAFSSTATITTATPCGDIMIQPVETIQITVTAGGIEYAPITVSFATEKAKAGFAHEVTLTFKGTDITPTAKITKWNEGDKVDKEIK